VGGELDVLAGGRLLRQTLASGQIVVAGGRSPLEPVEYLRNRDSASGLRRRVVGGKSARISRAVFPVAAVGAMRRLASALTIFGVHGVPPVTAAVASPRPSRLPLPCPTRANLSAWLDGGTHTAVKRCGQAAGGPALAFPACGPVSFLMCAVDAQAGAIVLAHAVNDGWIAEGGPHVGVVVLSHLRRWRRR
jgi:hypothetical protein